MLSVNGKKKNFPSPLLPLGAGSTGARYRLPVRRNAEERRGSISSHLHPPATRAFLSDSAGGRGRVDLRARSPAASAVYRMWNGGPPSAPVLPTDGTWKRVQRRNACCLVYRENPNCGTPACVVFDRMPEVQQQEDRCCK
jgi:hypothetical protein